MKTQTIITKELHMIFLELYGCSEKARNAAEEALQTRRLIKGKMRNGLNPPLQ